jgi:hypothetical protein
LPPAASSHKLNSAPLPSLEDADSGTQFKLENPQASPDQQGFAVVDLTLSSGPVSPENSEGDFARVQGLPRGPGWVQKRGDGDRMKTRSSTGGARTGVGDSPSSSPSQPRRGGRARKSVI